MAGEIIQIFGIPNEIQNQAIEEMVRSSKMFTPQKWSFSLSISSVNVTKNFISCAVDINPFNIDSCQRLPLKNMLPSTQSKLL